MLEMGGTDWELNTVRDPSAAPVTSVPGTATASPDARDAQQKLPRLRVVGSIFRLAVLGFDSCAYFP
jgi:hypothetical protein